ncbi:trypsin-like peptidase domain-containing protein [Flavobacterium sp. 20NA77.7]|uniref:Trypsin-like peptidase domain-containing protein n=1 Tax=Flavobacterium nakdongensis TaxID=3073563 RepID=A0ABY9RB02_9FLAO|nr:trypsin-like peptidase domain-containing protein [Flavobacterium sp. 20NA77.7]WMW78422.1 trypsin-like peptidase domain-containing protein [Flavobacterium sp. 20NA77.7]
MQHVKSLFLVSLLSGAFTLGGYKLFIEKSNKSIVTSAPDYALPVGLTPEGVDFTVAAEKAVHSVVHVKNVSVITYTDPWSSFFYGRNNTQQYEQIGTGSGVIISEDGYIVTNNHVIKDAKELEVTLNNNKAYKAKLIGTDSKMDIALLKIDADEKLPFIVFGNSDQIKVGEWVLAVGNPYNLNSTVTAGIVSAKARNLDKASIQSFIQTDAAVNPGNSGGALVNARGELIGINTMISSPTGSYAGYSFAVPSNITKKIIEDLVQFGNVQRGVLGVDGSELNAEASKKLGIKETEGIFVNKINKNSGAQKAGITKGDIIIKLDDKKVTNNAELSAIVNTKRPNDVIKVSLMREGKLVVVPVKLTKKELIQYEYNGIEFEDVTEEDKRTFNITSGIKIKVVTNEEFQEYAEYLKGSIVRRVDGILATNMETVSAYLAKKEEKQKTQYEIIGKNGRVYRFIL